jgi:hypothetical protein
MAQHPFRGNNKGGRPSKGPRHTHTVRIPLPLDEAIEQSAVAAGYTNCNDFIVEVLDRARKAGLFPQAAAGQMKLQASA